MPHSTVMDQTGQVRRPGKTEQDRLPVGQRPRVREAQRRLERPNHDRRHPALNRR